MHVSRAHKDSAEAVRDRKDIEIKSRKWKHSSFTLPSKPPHLYVQCVHMHVICLSVILTDSASLNSFTNLYVNLHLLSKTLFLFFTSYLVRK